MASGEGEVFGELYYEAGDDMDVSDQGTENLEAEGLTKEIVIDMYTPHEKTDGLLRRIFQTCYGRTDSKKISADCANLVRTALGELNLYENEKLCQIFVARRGEKYLGFVIAHGTMIYDMVNNLPSRSFHEKIAEINYLSYASELSPDEIMNVCVTLVQEASLWCAEKKFDKVQIRCCMGWDSDAYQLCSYQFLGDQIEADAVFSFWLLSIDMNSAVICPAEMMARDLVFYNRMPEFLSMADHEQLLEEAEKAAYEDEAAEHKKEEIAGEN